MLQIPPRFRNIGRQGGLPSGVQGIFGESDFSDGYFNFYFYIF